MVSGYCLVPRQYLDIALVAGKFDLPMQSVTYVAIQLTNACFILAVVLV